MRHTAEHNGIFQGTGDMPLLDNIIERLRALFSRCDLIHHTSLLHAKCCARLIGVRFPVLVLWYSTGQYGHLVL